VALSWRIGDDDVLPETLLAFAIVLRFPAKVFQATTGQFRYSLCRRGFVLTAGAHEMRKPIWITLRVVLIAMAFLTPSPGETAQRSGPRYSYGYYPYKSHYGPIEAQYELEGLTYHPAIKGVDYGYGLDYFFGSGPPYHYHGLRAWFAR
jgi:hypothetical protein